MKQPCVYILASRPNGTLYIGVTSDLYGRMAEHKQGLTEGFINKHGVTRLVYYDPEWLDLFEEMNGTLRNPPADSAQLRGGYREC